MSGSELAWKAAKLFWKSIAIIPGQPEAVIQPDSEAERHAGARPVAQEHGGPSEAEQEPVAVHGGHQGGPEGAEPGLVDLPGAGHGVEAGVGERWKERDQNMHCGFCYKSRLNIPEGLVPHPLLCT